MKENKKINIEKNEKSLAGVSRKGSGKDDGTINLTYNLPVQKRKVKSNYVADIKKEKRDVMRDTVDPYELADYKNVRMITTKTKKKKPFPFAMVFVIVVVACMLFFLMMNYASLERANREIAAMNSQLTQLKKSEQALSKQLNEYEDLRVAEDYAKNTLNMVKSDKLSSNTVSTVKKDQGNVIEYGRDDENKVLFLLSGIGRVFSDFFGGKS